MGHSLSTLWFIAGLHIRTRLEYRASLLLGWSSQAFGYASAYAAIWLILARFEVLGGWRWPEMALLLGFHILSYSLGASLSFVQMRDMEGLVQRGEFDALLVKPISPWAYLVFSGLNIGYGGHILLGLGMIVWALTLVHPAWAAWTIPFALAALISAAMLVCSVMTMIGATALIWGRSNYLYSIFFGFWQLARYPLNIFSGAIQVIMLTVMPLAFISYVPVASILGKDIPILGAWGPALTLVAGPLSAGVAMLHWRYCVRHYQSGGG